MAQILLINPSYFEPAQLQSRYASYRDWIERGNMYICPFEPPLGLAALVAYMRERGIDAELLDLQGLGFDEDGLRSHLVRTKPTWVGITAMSPTYPAALKIARMVKDVLPGAKTILGGVHPTVSPEQVLAHSQVDYAVCGEGEEVLARLLTEERGPIVGLHARDLDPRAGKGRAAVVEDIDSLPMPEYGAFPIEQYVEYNEHLRGIRGISMLVTRGCPYQCSFCAVYVTMGRHWRAKSPARVVGEMRRLRNEFRVEGIWFKDSIFNLDKSWLREFCRNMAEQELGMQWQCNTRVDLVDAESLKMMRDAGMTQIDLGIESGSPKTLKTLRKNITVEQIRAAVRLAKEYVKVAGFFMIGVPGETLADVESTVKLARELELDKCSWSVYAPLPGSPLYQELLRNGMAELTENELREIHFTRVPRSMCKIPTEELNRIYSEINSEFAGRTVEQKCK